MLSSFSSQKSLNIVITSYAKTSGQDVKAYKARLYAVLKITTSKELTNDQISQIIKELNIRIFTALISKAINLLAQIILSLISKVTVKSRTPTFLRYTYKLLAISSYFIVNFQIKNKHPPPFQIQTKINLDLKF